MHHVQLCIQLKLAGSFFKLGVLLPCIDSSVPVLFFPSSVLGLIFYYFELFLSVRQNDAIIICMDLFS